MDDDKLSTTQKESANDGSPSTESTEPLTDNRDVDTSPVVVKKSLNKKRRVQQQALSKKVQDKLIEDLNKSNRSDSDFESIDTASEWSNEKFRSKTLGHHPDLSKNSPVLSHRAIRQVRKIATSEAKKICNFMDQNMDKKPENSQQQPGVFPVGDEEFQDDSEKNSQDNHKELQRQAFFNSLTKDESEERIIDGDAYLVLKDSTFDMINPRAKMVKGADQLDMCPNQAFNYVFHLSWDSGLSDEGLICRKHADIILRNVKDCHVKSSKRGYVTASSSCMSTRALMVTLHIFGKEIPVKFQIMEDRVFPMMVGQKVMGRLGIDQLNSIQSFAFGNRTEAMCQHSNMPAIDCVILDKKILSKSHPAVVHQNKKQQCLLTQESSDEQTTGSKDSGKCDCESC